MKIDSKFKYIYILELSPAEYRLLCNAMSDSEAAVSIESPDYAAIVKMEEQLGDYRASSEARVRVVA